MNTRNRTRTVTHTHIHANTQACIHYKELVEKKALYKSNRSNAISYFILPKDIETIGLCTTSLIIITSLIWVY